MFKVYVALILVVEVLGLALLPLVAPVKVPLLLAPVVPLTLVAALVVYHRLQSPSFRARWLSPDRITNYTPRELPVASPERLSQSLVERAAEIRRVLQGSPSEVQVEMCTLGYRTCVNDMITLTHLVNEELANAGFLRRIKLTRARKRATDALAGARKSLPPGALRATHQEQQ